MGAVQLALFEVPSARKPSVQAPGVMPAVVPGPRPANDVARPLPGGSSEVQAFLAAAVRAEAAASAGRFTAADEALVTSVWSVGGLPSSVARSRVPSVAREWLAAAATLRAERLAPHELRSQLCVRSAGAGSPETRALALHTLCALATRSVSLRNRLRDGVRAAR